MCAAGMLQAPLVKSGSVLAGVFSKATDVCAQVMLLTHLASRSPRDHLVAFQYHSSRSNARQRVLPHVREVYSGQACLQQVLYF